MTLGYHENFPPNLHRVEGFNTSLTIKQLQQKLLKTLCQLNRKEFKFEDVTSPTFPDGIAIFEFGLSDDKSFNYLDEEELEKAEVFISKERVQVLDFFIAIRYYKESNKKKPLKFDYYLLRWVFGKEILEVQVFHERGPRHISPEDLVNFITNKINDNQTKRILKQIT